MKQIVFLSFVGLMSFFFLPRLSGQILSSGVHYRCDFEDATENEQWRVEGYHICNSSWTIDNFDSPWYIGTSVNNGGSQGLYTSNDYGVTNYVGSNSSTTYATRVLTLPAGDYELSLDWKSGSSGKANALFVAWVPSSVSICNIPNANSRPSTVENYFLVPQGETTDSLRSATWRTSVFSFTSDGTEGVLAIVFAQKGNYGSSVEGAGVDNIYIKPAGGCETPTNLAAELVDDHIELTWMGYTSYTYDVRCYSYTTDSWQEVSGVSGLTYSFYGVQTSVYDFYVRTVCDDETSHWVHVSELFYLAVGCVDYTNLSWNNCYIGQAGGAGSIIPDGAMSGYVDYGPGDSRSRHTVYTTPGEYDANTNYQLLTIPDGAIASVRLGNDNVGSEAEMIEYSFFVDKEVAGVLLLQYAVVLENPGHSDDQQPYFTMRVLDPSGTSLPCAYAKFVSASNTTDETWHLVSVNNSSVYWKEWTTIGVDLSDYDGQLMTIQLSTFDCSLGGHWGYAYFVIECSSGELEGITCGEVNNEFTAPEGFEYRWYTADNPDEVLGTSRTFTVDGRTDTTTYYCDVIFAAASADVTNCYYTLVASSIPRFPVADATYTVLNEGDCRNVVSFTNLSHVMTVNQVSGDTTHTESSCESIVWDFGDGTTTMETNPTHEFPLEGGTYNVVLKAGMSDDLCVDSLVIPITLPRLGTQYDTIVCYGCSNSLPLVLPNGQQVWYTQDIVDSIGDMKATNGCDSITVYRAIISERMEVYDTICSDDIPYLFDGQELTTSGTYTIEGGSVGGCDSVLYLTVYDDLHVNLLATPSACADEPTIDIEYVVTYGLATDFLLEYTGEAARYFSNTSGVVPASPISIALPDDVRPGNYTADLIFINSDCNNDTVAMQFVIYYPDSVVAQRWDDVLFVKNADYNGGYNFSSFQWYKDGEPLVGETDSYLRVAGGLDVNSEYCVALTRSDDGMTVMNCPMRPHELQQEVTLSLTQSMVSPGAQVQMTSPRSGQAALYTTSGVLMATYRLTEGTNSLTAPSQPGYYLLRAVLDNGVVKTFHLQVGD